jgi:hypothetical protein
MHSVVAFVSENDWSEQTVKDALVDFVRPGLTAGELGVNWKSTSGYSGLDGLWPLAVAVRGKYLFVADGGSLLAATLANMERKTTASPSKMTAGFNHQSERGSFVKLTTMLNLDNPSGGPGQAPDFLSGNIGSLSQTLRGVTSEKIVVRDTADTQMQTVTYVWAM